MSVVFSSSQSDGVTAETCRVIGVVSPSEEYAESLSRSLRAQSFLHRVRWIRSLAMLEDAAEVLSYSALVVAPPHSATSVSGILQSVRSATHELPVILACTSLAHSHLLQAIIQGATTILPDGPDFELLARVVRREAEISESLRGESRLRAELAAYQSRDATLTASLDQPHLRIQDGIVVGANPAFLALVGVASIDDLPSATVIDLIAGPDQATAKFVLKSLISGKPIKGPPTLKISTPTGTRSTVWRSIRTVVGEDVVIDVVLVTEQEVAAPAPVVEAPPATVSAAAADHLDRAAPTEVLVTAPAPRRAIPSDLDRRANQAGARGVMVIRLDEIESFEDKAGPIAAQDLVERVMAIARSNLRDTDLVVCDGPGEIFVAVSSAEINDIIAIGQRVSRQLKGAVIKTDGYQTALSVTVAVVPLTSAVSSDQALAIALTEGRQLSRKTPGGFGVFGPAALSATAEMELAQKAEAISRAIRAGGVGLNFYSIESLEGLEQTLIEGRLKLTLESGEVLQPAEFVPVARKAKLFPLLDRAAVVNAIRAYQRVAPSDSPHAVFVNLAIETLQTTPGFAEWIADLAAKGAVSAGGLVLAMDESIMTVAAQTAETFVREARVKGCGIALTHFGLDEAYAVHLEALQPDYVFLDSSLTQNLQSIDARQRLSTLVSNVRARGAKAIASKIADANTMTIFWQLGVEFVKGLQIQDHTSSRRG